MKDGKKSTVMKLKGKIIQNHIVGRSEHNISQQEISLSIQDIIDAD